MEDDRGTDARTRLGLPRRRSPGCAAESGLERPAWPGRPTIEALPRLIGDIAWGIGYFLFFWTGIPGLIAWIEALTFLTRSNEDWARQHGGPVDSHDGCAIGCPGALALLPFLAIGLIVMLVFLDGSIDVLVSAIESDL